MRSSANIDPDAAWKTLDGVRDWIKVADSKAVAAVTGSGVLAGLVIKALPPLAKHPHNAWHFWLLLASIVVATIAALIGLSVVTPHLRNRATGKSHIFFGDIAKVKNERLYRKQLDALVKNRKDLVDELSRQIWVTARIARTKHFRAGLSLRLLSAALLLAGIGTLLKGH